MVEQHAEKGYTFRALRFLYATLAVSVILAMYPYTARPTEDIKILIYQLGASVVLIIFVTHALVTRRKFQRPPLLAPAIAGLLVMYAFGALASQFVVYSLVEWSKWASLVVLYLVATQIYRSIASIRIFLTVVCCAVALATLYGFIQKAGMDPFPWNEQAMKHEVYRGLPATFGNPNLAGHVLIIAFIAALYLTTLRGTRWCALLAILFAVHMVYTHQRSIVFALTAAAVLVLLAVLARRCTRKPAAAVVLVLSSLLVLAAAAAGVLAYWVQSTDTRIAPIDTSLRLRYNAFYSAIQMIHEKPVLGFGPGNYRIENTPFWTDHEQEWFAQERLMNFNVHNDFLEAAVEGGIPAGICYTAFLALAIAAGIYLYVSRETPAERRFGLTVAAVFLAFAVDGVFGFNVHVPVSGLLIFVLAGMIDGMLSSALGAPEPSKSSPRIWFWPALYGVAALANAAVALLGFYSEVYLQRGQGAQHWKAYDVAEASYRRAERLAPWNWLAPYQLGIAHTAQGKPEEAASDFLRAVQKNPYYIPALSYLAQNSFNRAAPVLVNGNHDPSVVEKANSLLDGAADAANTALSLCASWPEADDILGRIDFVRATWLNASPAQPRNVYGSSQNLWQSATAHFERALANGLGQAKEPLRLLAQIGIALHQPAAAEKYLYRALDADPNDTAVWATFWEYARTTGAYAQMRSALQRRIQLLTPPKTDAAARALADTHSWMARLQQQGFKDTPKAADAYCRAVSTTPLREDLWNAYGSFALANGLESQFIECLRTQVAGQQPDAGSLAQVAAVAAAISGDPQRLVQAASILTDLVRDNPDPNSLRNHGVTWAAPIVLERVRAAAPAASSARAQALLGEVFQALGQFETAHGLLAASMPNLDPNERAAVATRLAGVLHSMRKTNESVRVLHDAMTQDPRNGQLQLHYARALARAGRYAEARLEYDTILKTYALGEETLRQVQQEIAALPIPTP